VKIVDCFPETFREVCSIRVYVEITMFIYQVRSLKTLIQNDGFPKRVMIQRSDTDTPTLQHSHVSGSIPKEIDALVALTSIDLSVTGIEGTLKIKEMKLYHS